MREWFEYPYELITIRVIGYLVIISVILWRAVWGADPIEGFEERPRFGRRRPPRELPQLSLAERIQTIAEMRDRGQISQEEHDDRRQRILDSV